MTNQRSLFSNLGIYIYALAAILLGLAGLLSGEFAAPWQSAHPNLPLRVPLAYLTAVIELAAGIALLIPRAARIAAFTLTILYSIFTLAWVPRAFINLGNFDPIGNVFEELSLVAAGLVLCATLSSPNHSRIFQFLARYRQYFIYIFAVCSISFGIVHIVDMPGLLNWIPAWLPPSKMFWAYATTLGFFAAAVAILTGICAPLAARLLTAEIIIFELLIWVPNFIASPSNHFNWAGNAICIAIAGAAWVISDSISASAPPAKEASSIRAIT